MNAVFFLTAAAACVAHNTDAPIVAVKYRERGFYPIYTQATPEQLNARDGWTAEEIESAHRASMFGWDCKGAQVAREAVEKREAPLTVAEVVSALRLVHDELRAWCDHEPDAADTAALNASYAILKRVQS